MRDAHGSVINPVKRENANVPYSPKQTCGACHDYTKITEGFHFQQGAGERPTEDQAARCQWASTPGNYGGTWCSPGPLYRWLSPKKNESAGTIDMTSFEFIVAGCAECHPGGGPMEFDRDGHRYDEWMRDPAHGLIPGGDNGFDGDYYKARWSETGVLEADCLLCHLPEYDNAARKQQLKGLNFAWAPTVAAGFGQVEGTVAKGETPMVTYDTTRFDAEGRVAPHIVRSPRNETCLECHAQPGWKKRGADYRARTDVHLRAGLRCVDCHAAGMSAADERIRGKELHQVGKGDDPGGHVRDDLDDTVRSCASCHTTGYLGAPVAAHKAFPADHLETIACVTCHIPQRVVEPILMQASDVFNPGAHIPSKAKHLWVFYGPDMQYRNHYGVLVTMGFNDKPTDPFTPTYVRYKDKIWPVNRVHTAWPAIQTQGQPGLAQPKMSDLYKMWTDHRADPSKYAALAQITDDTGDGVIEVNRPEEIDALIDAVTAMLRTTDYPMAGKRVLWVMDDRAYSSGTEFREIPKHDYEASPYGNVHKYSHEVYPARAALGVRGCQDCHSDQAPLLFQQVVQYPFGTDGKPVTVPQYTLLGMTGERAKELAALGAP
ncbi:MAG: multiheme c-type cytochrome [Candidatus Zipacnadales bacterium]